VIIDGAQQGMAGTYGPHLKFVAFDVMVNDKWQNVSEAADYCKNYLKLVSTLDAERDQESVQAIKNGMGHGKKREGALYTSVS
jgi:hypothetical protein